VEPLTEAASPSGLAVSACVGNPAAYGLDTAHYGPDAGTPGRADGCYRTTDGVASGQDAASPVVR